MDEGSVMIVVATDAPLAHRELSRLAGRAFLGVARTGSSMSHGSGDYAVAFSTRPYPEPRASVAGAAAGRDDGEAAARARIRDGAVLSTLFEAVVEATEEAVLNSLFRATTVTGRGGRTAEALPVDEVLELLRRRGMLEGGGR